MNTFFETSALDNSWVELITNLAYIDNPDTSSLSNLHLGRKMPKGLFYSYVHEATHHWTFTSVFGTLCYLNYRNAQNLLRELNSNKQNKNESLHWDLFSEYFKFKALNDIYKPLIEGMACFAELDIYPSKTEAIPNHLVMASYLFSDIENPRFSENNLAEVEESYNNFLLRLRILSENGVGKKMTLLQSKLKSNPYLVGYLFVKNLQSFMMNKIDLRFKDGNVFLQFLRTYYFNDFDLAELILDKDTIDENISYKLVNHFQEKTSAMQHLPENTYDKLVEFELTPNTRKEQLGFLSKKEVVENVIAILEEKIQSLHNSDNEVNEWTMRSFFRIAKLKVYLKINDGLLKLYHSFPLELLKQERINQLLEIGAGFVSDGYMNIMALRLAENSEFVDFEGFGFYEKYVSFTDFGEFSIIKSSEDKKIKGFTFSDNLKFNKEELIEFYESHNDLPTFAPIEDYLNGHDSEIFFDAIKENHLENLAALEQYYNTLALACDRNSIDKLVLKMSNSGLAKILDYDFELLQTLSKLSLLSSKGPVAREDLKVFKIDQKLVDKLTEKLDENGLNLVQEVEGIILSYCI